jgi:CRP/FNR family cyclic AMP-dependent transcriptional regulator
VEPTPVQQTRVSPPRAGGAGGTERRRYRRYLLDLDPDLAGELDVRMRLVARPATAAVTFEVDPGGLELASWLSATAAGPGLLVLDGALVSYTRVCDRSSAELLGRGDLIQPLEDDEEFVSGEVAWRALRPTQFALLDAAFAERIRAWPQIGCSLLRRCERRARELAVIRTIAAQPRLELRLILLLWHLTGRWGRVQPGGVRLALPLTHELLGRLVGAERPSVSHALTRLAAAGLISGDERGRHLHGALSDHIEAVGSSPLPGGRSSARAPERRTASLRGR